MLETIKKLFGIGPSVDLKEVARNGAVILDVRTKGEFQSGHIKGALNIPVQNLASSLAKISKDKAVITCCASGMRSASAKGILASNGFKEVYNGGSWMSLRNKIS
jgi:rhodanese-related sulfurtransferase